MFTSLGGEGGGVYSKLVCRVVTSPGGTEIHIRDAPPPADIPTGPRNCWRSDVFDQSKLGKIKDKENEKEKIYTF